ncbi:unnamed protein product, partial [Protopolystoma xenopodis]
MSRRNQADLAFISKFPLSLEQILAELSSIRLDVPVDLSFDALCNACEIPLVLNPRRSFCHICNRPTCPRCLSCYFGRVPGLWYNEQSPKTSDPPGITPVNGQYNSSSQQVGLSRPPISRIPNSAPGACLESMPTSLPSASFQCPPPLR